jgi:hypothetical protein
LPFLPGTHKLMPGNTLVEFRRSVHTDLIDAKHGNWGWREKFFVIG